MGTRTPEIWEDKNVQNVALFRTTLNFDRECLRKGSICRQADNGVISYNISHVGRKNWWTSVY